MVCQKLETQSTPKTFTTLHEYFEAGKYQPPGPIFGGATHLHLAATYSMLGNYKKARDHIKALFSINPKFSPKGWDKYSFWWGWRSEVLKRELISGHRQSMAPSRGLPHTPGSAGGR